MLKDAPRRPTPLHRCVAVRAQAVLKNWIDASELAAVWAGPRRVRVRESDLDSFLAESAIRRERLEEGDPWAKVGEAAKAVASAVRGQDREPSIARSRDWRTPLGRSPQARRALSPDPTAPAQFAIGVVSSAADGLLL